MNAAPSYGWTSDMTLDEPTRILMKSARWRFFFAWPSGRLQSSIPHKRYIETQFVAGAPVVNEKQPPNLKICSCLS